MSLFHKIKFAYIVHKSGKQWRKESRRDTWNGFKEDVLNPIKDLAKNAPAEFKTIIIDQLDEDLPVVGKAVKKVDNAMTSTKNFIDGTSPHKVTKRILSSNVKELKHADHLYVQRFAYTHHGLYCKDDDTVLHYSDGEIREDPLSDFAKGMPIQVKKSPIIYAPEEVMRRAISRFTESKYGPVFNNCEHFVRWCRSGGKKP